MPAASFPFMVAFKANLFALAQVSYSFSKDLPGSGLGETGKEFFEQLVSKTCKLTNQRKPEGQRATKRCSLVVAVFLTQADGSPKVGIQV
eukprot:994918-Rhodomonas_salina.1